MNLENTSHVQKILINPQNLSKIKVKISKLNFLESQQFKIANSAPITCTQSLLICEWSIMDRRRKTKGEVEKIIPYTGNSGSMRNSSAIT